MAINFYPDKHLYQSNDGQNIDWISATTFVKSFHPEFDAVAQSKKSAVNKKSIWYGLDPKEIQQAWLDEGIRASTLGTWYHNQQERNLCDLETIVRWGKEIRVVKPLTDADGVKIAPGQKLQEGMYPEHLVYLKSAGVCGQSDLVEIVDGLIHITDYKTNKEIKTKGFYNWQERSTDKMLPPLQHMEDCHLTHYNLQLTLYMYMMLKHNPRLKPGTMTLHHIIFETDGENKYGYPITKLDNNKEPIVAHVVPYELPYLKDEVIAMLNWLKTNRDNVKQRH